jgi:hypothetical protein
MEDILDVEFTLGNGQKIEMSIQQSEDWSEIKKDIRAIMNLINGESLFVSIQSACEDEGVAFKIIGSTNDTTYHYDANVVDVILTEVKQEIINL